MIFYMSQKWKCFHYFFGLNYNRNKRTDKRPRLKTMARCLHCHKESRLISSPLELCAGCVRRHFEEVKPHIDQVHARVRSMFELPVQPPQDEAGLLCPLCVNQCRIVEQGRGFCGVRKNRERKLKGGRPGEGLFSSYYDPLPTNCVAAWVCAASKNGGHSLSPGSRRERGDKNLAVFFEACTFDCLFCQNWHYREESLKPGYLGPEAIADRVDDRTACICYFGGDPTPQMLYALKASKIALDRNPDRELRICWETNGSMNLKLLEKAAEISLQSGGCVKFDLKASDEHLHYALCGVSNHRTLDNFAHLAEGCERRPEPPLLVASTLLVPGYVDEQEVSDIARFIASLDPDIPYSLLGFAPHFFMKDLPTTSRSHAGRCLTAAQEAGLNRVRVGNVHLLGNAY